MAEVLSLGPSVSGTIKPHRQWQTLSCRTYRIHEQKKGREGNRNRWGSDYSKGPSAPVAQMQSDHMSPGSVLSPPGGVASCNR